MRDANLPEFHFAVIGVRHPNGSVGVRLRALMQSGDWMTLHHVDGPHGRLDARQIEDLAATVSNYLSEAVISRWGVQGLLT